MDILKIAENSGLLVTLDGKIGRQEYQSVYGSITALSRFANAILEYANIKAPLSAADEVQNRSSIVN
ncbi:hypothetical protein VOI32_03355 [Paraburkholderia caribensis]|uniref:Uncharacterized protein n=1 Tax=Paraburkholderia caribensis TaxID=75105 RepID=A0A9Q6S7S2_9BURK|nr:hypothetical protein [Paraburkholderia caribensis]MCO4878285.1 hypothetical protein [Paraburkholderia caribensis]PTB28616.1 hypothetical protein C9I56_11435 [Paraburkholderia caribensis]QLB66081.1 hypothetical protein A9O66_27745 [Paraburkholderia caribensis]